MSSLGHLSKDRAYKNKCGHFSLLFSHGIQIKLHGKVTRFCLPSEKENDKQSLRADPDSFPMGAGRVDPLPFHFQVLKLKISKPLEILVIFSEGYKKTGLGFCQGSSGHFDFIFIFS